MTERLRREAELGDELAAEELIRALRREGRWAELVELARAAGRPVPELAAIPAGAATLGSPSDEDGRYPDEHQLAVMIHEPYWIGTAPVTQAEWRAVMGTAPSQFDGDDLPVESVSWYDAVSYCNALSKLVGLPEAYHIEGQQVRWLGGPGFRLPSEVEWEYACRAGTTGPRYGELEEIAWWWGNSGGTTHPVRQKMPNAWGLYDTIGNVWEWCWDRYGERMVEAAPDGPFDEEARAGSTAVAAGSTARGTAGRRSETAARRRSDTTAAGSASAGEGEHCRPFDEQARAGSTEVAAGTATRGSAGRRSASTTRLGPTSITGDSASLEEAEEAPPFDLQARAGSTEVAAGTATRSTAGRRSAAGIRRRAAAATSGSASREEGEHCRPFEEQARARSSAVAAGSTSRSSAGRRSASWIRRRTATSSSGSASREAEVDECVRSGSMKVRRPALVLRTHTMSRAGATKPVATCGFCCYTHPVRRTKEDDMNETEIAWTELSWNPMSGCRPASEGCRYCYARALAERKRGTPAFPDGFDLTIRPHKLREPSRLKGGELVFLNSMSDLFWNEIPDSYRDRVLDVVDATPGVTFQTLTKRPEKLASVASKRQLPPNLWVGVSVESQRHADRIDIIRGVDAALRFISFEPLLSPISVDLSGIGWVIVGGESGSHLWKDDIRAERGLSTYDRKTKAWAPHDERAGWVRSIRDRCKADGVPFFFKQWGGARPSIAGHILDGRVHHEYPTVARARGTAFGDRRGQVQPSVDRRVGAHSPSLFP